MTQRNTGRVVSWLIGVVASASAALGVGPDVTLNDILSTSNYGAIGGIRAYAIGSHTCNIGNTNLLWLNGGTPAVAMNMFRLNNGRLTQIGLGWAKHACCAAAGSGPCGSCNGQGGQVLGAGCLDVYGSGFNGGQFGLGPRSRINPYTGTFTALGGNAGSEIARRLQVQQSNMLLSGFPGSLFFVEGVYVGSDDATSNNRNNNATHKRVTVNQTSFDLTLQGTAQVGRPAIFAWRDHGGGANIVDPAVVINTIDIPGEGRIFVGHKVIDVGNGRWRYEYAIYNLSSDKAVGKLTIPLPSGLVISSPFFSAPVYHSGELTVNTPWTIEQGSCGVSWSTAQTFAQNPNANSIRWGTMYNFSFTTTTAPVDGNATVGLFKPHTTQQMVTSVLVPGAPTCRADFDHNGTVDPDDLADFVTCFFTPSCTCADIDGSGTTDPDDLSDFITGFFQAVQNGC